MGQEIERKFLIKNLPSDLSINHGSIIHQGYIFIENEKHLRIRYIEGLDNGILCLKFTPKNTPIRQEHEWEITSEEAKQLFDKCAYKLTKKRYRYLWDRDGACVWMDIDVYGKDLKVVEVEFDSEESMKSFVKPDFFGEEISGKRKYSNIQIAKQAEKKLMKEKINSKY